MNFDFLTEYKKLQLQTPRLSSFVIASENSAYNFNVKNAKNCYMIANSVDSEDCLYGRDFYNCTDCIDCDHIQSCTLCYQALNCENCYDCQFIQDSQNCSHCRYGYSLKGCTDCVGCVGLRQKQYHIFNEAYSKEDYEAKLQTLSREDIKTRFEALKKQIPRKGIDEIDSENFTGSGVFHSKNIDESFDVSECQDGGYLLETKKVTDSWDISILEEAEQCYQISSCHIMSNAVCCYFCVNSHNVEYSENLIDCQDCFGCISLKRKQYYILNQPYSKEEYFEKVAAIKAQLREQGLYGKMLLPPTFPKEDTVAMMPTL